MNCGFGIVTTGGWAQVRAQAGMLQHRWLCKGRAPPWCPGCCLESVPMADWPPCTYLIVLEQAILAAFCRVLNIQANGSSDAWVMETSRICIYDRLQVPCALLQLRTTGQPLILLPQTLSHLYLFPLVPQSNGFKL